MRVPLTRGRLAIVAGLVLAVLTVALEFGPCVRSKVAAEAARRHLDVGVGGLRPGWWAVRLVDVRVRPHAMDAAEVHLDEVVVRLSLGLHVDAVEVHGGDITVKGDAERLREEWSTWRAQSAEGRPDGPRRRSPSIAADSIAVRWIEEGNPTPRAELRGVGFIRDGEGTRVVVESARVEAEIARLELIEGSIGLDSSGALVRAHAGSLQVAWSPRVQPASSPPPPLPALAEPSSAGFTSPLLVAHTTSPRRAPLPAPPKSVDPSTPLVRLPDTHRGAESIAFLVSALSQHIPEGAEASIDAMTWKMAPEDEERRVAFTIGPGPFALTRGPTRIELRFSTDPHAVSTSLAARALLPTDGGDVSVTLEGGPVSLSLLGIHDGAAGLVDVDKATVTGKARLTLAGDGSAVTFDAELGTRGLSLSEAKLARDVVRGVDLDVRARGAITDAGEMRLDDLAATLGFLHLSGSGSLEQKPDHVAASLHFDLPSTSCQSLLDSIPTALLPALAGTKMTGAFGARGRFAFDTRSLDELDLAYDVADECRVVEVSPALAREHFKQPFAHRIYLPDGSTTEQMTGPGTPNWTSLGQISPYIQVAVMTTEDGAFSHHRGFNRPAIRASIVTNLKARRFVRGASTITMQLAKNLFLSRDKTLARKLQEVVLTDYLEQTFSKDEIMELYLNVIEFGPAVYGITAASEYYFGRSPSDLNLAEGLFLSSLLPAPIRYGSMRDLPQAPEGWMRTLRSLMQIADKRGLITDAELAEGQGEVITFWHGGPRPPPRVVTHLRSRLEGNEDDGEEPAPMPPEGP
jgi:hypothetical protein